jgi:hypothetical protein
MRVTLWCLIFCLFFQVAAGAIPHVHTHSGSQFVGGLQIQDPQGTHESLLKAELERSQTVDCTHHSCGTTLSSATQEITSQDCPACADTSHCEHVHPCHHGSLQGLLDQDWILAFLPQEKGWQTPTLGALRHVFPEIDRPQIAHS